MTGRVSAPPPGDRFPVVRVKVAPAYRVFPPDEICHPGPTLAPPFDRGTPALPGSGSGQRRPAPHRHRGSVAPRSSTAETAPIEWRGRGVTRDDSTHDVARGGRDRDLRLHGTARRLGQGQPGRSGDELAGIAAESQRQRGGGPVLPADIELRTFLAQPVVPGDDEVTDLIHHRHDPAAFALVAALTVGEFHDHLLAASPEQLAALAPGLTPEMVAAVSKIMRNQDLCGSPPDAR